MQHQRVEQYETERSLLPIDDMIHAKHDTFRLYNTEEPNFIILSELAYGMLVSASERMLGADTAHGEIVEYNGWKVVRMGQGMGYSYDTNFVIEFGY
jgi:hypothetical protein